MFKAIVCFLFHRRHWAFFSRGHQYGRYCRRCRRAWDIVRFI